MAIPILHSPRTPSPEPVSIDDSSPFFDPFTNEPLVDHSRLSPFPPSSPLNNHSTYASAASSPDRVQPNGTMSYTNGSVTMTTTATMSQAAVDRSPFQFKPTSMVPISKASLSRAATSRRGHKYKHSSVSHDIFLPPPSRPALTLPASLPIPTVTECLQSMTKEQKMRLAWCGGHAMVAGFILWHGRGSLAVTALSHLILFDALGALLCMVVDVLSNFEVWKRSSIRHPFGLERAEVLAGFAMSVLLLFMGFDLISHSVQDLIQGWAGEEEHGHVHHHNHQRVSPGSIDLSAVFAIVSTLVSAIGLKNHVRIGKAMQIGYFSSLPSVLSNPSHFLTLSCSSLLLLLPLLSVRMYAWLDRCLSVTIATSMIVLGVRLVKSLGSMLLMRYGGAGVPEVVKEIEQDPAVTTIDEASFWQVHHGLCMANLKMHVRLFDTTENKLRERITRLINNRLGGAYGLNQQRWEVTLQFSVTKD